jgi:hypothetical protein
MAMAKSQPMSVWEDFNPDAAIPESRLKAFLVNSDMTVPRERIFTGRLMSELKLAAAMVGYHLQHYEPDVDRDGHDVVLEDEYNVSYQQLKVACGGTVEWNVRKRLLRPDVRYREHFGIERIADENPGLEVEGLQGGVIVIIPQVNDTGVLVGTQFLYTDIFILSAIAYRLIACTDAAQQKAKRLREGLTRNQEEKTVVLPKACFIATKCPESLLALMGLRSRYSSSWRLNILRYVATANDSRLRNDEDAEQQLAIAEQIKKNLAQLTCAI